MRSCWQSRKSVTRQMSSGAIPALVTMDGKWLMINYALYEYDSERKSVYNDELDTINSYIGGYLM